MPVGVALFCVGMSVEKVYSHIWHAMIANHWIENLFRPNRKMSISLEYK